MFHPYKAIQELKEQESSLAVLCIGFGWSTAAIAARLGALILCTAAERWEKGRERAIITQLTMADLSIKLNPVHYCACIFCANLNLQFCMEQNKTFVLLFRQKQWFVKKYGVKKFFLKFTMHLKGIDNINGKMHFCCL